MSGEGWTADELAELIVAQIEERIGGIEEATLTSLHLALSDQILVMLRAGATAAYVDPVIEQVWHRLREAWERAEDAPEQTHRNRSSLLS